MEHEVVGRAPLTFVESENVVPIFLCSLGRGFELAVVAIPGFFSAEGKRFLVGVESHVHPWVQEARSSRIVVWSLDAHAVGVFLLVISEAALATLVGSSGVQTDKLVRTVGILSESDERVLPYCNAEVGIRHVRFQSHLRKHVVVHGARAQFVSLLTRRDILLRCKSLYLQVYAARRSTVHKALFTRSGRAVCIGPYSIIAEFAAEVPSEVFLRCRTLAVNRNVGDGHVPRRVFPILEADS